MQSADLLALAAPAASTDRPRSDRRSADAADDAFARTLGRLGREEETTARTAPPSPDSTYTDPVRPGDRDGQRIRDRFGGDREPRLGRLGVGAQLGRRDAAGLEELEAMIAEFRALVGKAGGNPDTARTDAPTGGVDPKPDPKAGPPTLEQITATLEAMQALRAAVRAAMQDPAGAGATPGQIPPSVQAAMDQVAAVAPPAMAEKVEAFLGRMGERIAARLTAALENAGGESPAPAATAADGEAKAAPIAQAVLDALGKGEEAAAAGAVRLAAREAGTPAETPTPAAPSAADNAKPAEASPTPAALAAAAEEAEPAAARLAEPPAETAEGAASTAPSSQSASEARAAAAQAVRGSPETVATLAAAIVRKLEGRTTRFDMELNPGDMGRVDVRLRIDADGRVAAQMAFDNPVAAADLRARADELRRQLEQAGFQIASEDLSFTDRETGGFDRGAFEQPDPEVAAKRAFREAERVSRLAEDAERLTTRTVVGLDVRV